MRHIFNSFASCCCFKKNILHWALKETYYRSISDEYRCDFTVIYSFFRPWVTPLKSRDSRLKILINEWSEIFDSNWALKPQRKRELRFARQVLSEIFKAKLNRELQCKHWARSTQFWLVYALLRYNKTIWLAKGRNAYFIVETRWSAANEYSWVSKYVDSRFIHNLNSTHVQCVGNAHETQIRRTNTRAVV